MASRELKMAASLPPSRHWRHVWLPDLHTHLQPTSRCSHGRVSRLHTQPQANG
ncbi:hypothetical protein DPEC_G00371150 [Dallia pectoralis]|nr:hypothetical protein DPEC_G00371150 [Dallia pectoralis]